MLEKLFSVLIPKETTYILEILQKDVTLTTLWVFIDEIINLLCDTEMGWWHWPYPALARESSQGRVRPGQVKARAG